MIQSEKSPAEVTLENIKIVTDAYGIPLGPLLVSSDDRASFKPHDRTLIAMLNLCAKGSFSPSRIIHPAHGKVAHSFREDVWKGSMQINFGCAYQDSTVTHIEIDIDVFNPDRDLAGFLGHMIELIDPRKTNPTRIRKYLINRWGVR